MSHSIVDLVYAAKGDSLQADKIIREYLPFIKSEASKATGRFITDNCDELSIAMIAFHQAVESYSKTRGAFLSYASVVIKRKLIDYYRKEKRHSDQLSLDAPIADTDSISLLDTMEDPDDTYSSLHLRDATAEEILELSSQLSDYGLSLTDIADNSPKQERTLSACWKVLHFARENTEILRDVLRLGKLPITKLSQETGVEKKTLERHRKYLMALMIIHSNGYEIIRGHIKQVLQPEKVGESV